MSEQSTPTNRAQALRDEVRAMRARYDALDRGGKAAIRRHRIATELPLERVYWQVAGGLGRTEWNLEHVVLLFPLATQRGHQRFSFGKYLARELGDNAGARLRFRRLVASRDRDELDHRLRDLLRLADGVHNPVDWGELGRDILWFFAESDAVRRSWAQDFYAPVSSTPFTSPAESRE